VTRTGITAVDIMEPIEFACLLVGAMLPYAFSALTMSAVGRAANEMVAEIRDQFRDGEIINGRRDPDYRNALLSQPRHLSSR